MRLGQHFLKNERALKLIARSLNLKPRDNLIELGPGHGELTKFLLASKIDFSLIAIEKDERLANSLKESFKDDRLCVAVGDLRIIVPQLAERFSKYKLAGNIPYYLSGYLFRLIQECKTKPEKIIFTLQREVAERIMAKPGKMNKLAASVQFWAKPKILMRLGKNDFSPPPEVDSAVLELIPLNKLPMPPEKYYELMNKVFRQPRKTLANNLIFGSQIERKALETKLRQLDIEPLLRPQDLSVPDLVKLTLHF